MPINPCNATPQEVDSGTGSAGTSDLYSRCDHKHVLANLGVATAKIADLAVTSGKIADGAVLTAKIGDAQVTDAKLADPKVSKAGDTMTGDLTIFKSQAALNLKDTLYNKNIRLQNLANLFNIRDELNALKFELVMDTGAVGLFGTLSMNNNRIAGLADPSGTQDAATKSYADTKVAKAGDVLSGNLDFAKNQALQLVLHKGTAFPSLPVAGQLFYRTDLNKVYKYSGTQWEEMGTGGAPTTASYVTINDETASLPSSVRHVNIPEDQKHTPKAHTLDSHQLEADGTNKLSEELRLYDGSTKVQELQVATRRHIIEPFTRPWDWNRLTSPGGFLRSDPTDAIFAVHNHTTSSGGSAASRYAGLFNVSYLKDDNSNSNERTHCFYVHGAEVTATSGEFGVLIADVEGRQSAGQGTRDLWGVDLLLKSTASGIDTKMIGAMIQLNNRAPNSDADTAQAKEGLALRSNEQRCKAAITIQGDWKYGIDFRNPQRPGGYTPTITRQIMFDGDAANNTDDSIWHSADALYFRINGDTKAKITGVGFAEKSRQMGIAEIGIPAPTWWGTHTIAFGYTFNNPPRIWLTVRSDNPVGDRNQQCLFNVSVEDISTTQFTIRYHYVRPPSTDTKGDANIYVHWLAIDSYAVM